MLYLVFLFPQTLHSRLTGLGLSAVSLNNESNANMETVATSNR